jgi:hypothetical protein
LPKTHLDGKVAEELVGLGSLELVSGRELDVKLLLELLDHVETLPGGGEVELQLGSLLAFRVVLELVAAGKVVNEAGDERLGEVHEVVHVGVGHVELTDGEFGVVSKVDTLIPEDATDLVDTVKTTDDELLEVELGGDTHEEVEVEGVVVSDEGLRGSSTSDLVHHGRLDLEEAEVVEELADVVDDTSALDEDLATLLVHDQVEVTLAVTLLLVLEAEVLLGELVEVGREENDVLGGDGELVALGTKGVTGDTENVAATEEVVDGLELLRGLRVATRKEKISSEGRKRGNGGRKRTQRSP